MKFFIFWILLLFGRVTLACADSTTIFEFNLGEGEPGIEKLEVKSGSNTFKILDDDGLANLLLMTIATKSLSDQEIASLRPNFNRSVDKAKLYWENYLNQYQAKPPQNHDPAKQKQRIDLYTSMVENLGQLKTATASQLTRGHFVQLIKSVIQPGIDRIGYQTEKAGQVEQTAVPLKRILGTGIDDILYINSDGTFPKKKGDCASLSVVIGNMPSPTAIQHRTRDRTVR